MSTYEWSDAAVGAARSFHFTHDKGTPLADADSFKRGVVDRPGRIQSDRFGRAFFNRCSRRDLFRNNLAGVLLDCGQADATKCGPGYKRAPCWRTCVGARRRDWTACARSPELIGRCSA